MTDTVSLGSTAIQRILMQAEILFLVEEILIHMYSHFPRLTPRTICEAEAMAAALAIAGDAVHILSQRELE